MTDAFNVGDGLLLQGKQGSGTNTFILQLADQNTLFPNSKDFTLHIDHELLIDPPPRGNLNTMIF